MNSHQQMQRVSELRMRRWGRAGPSSSISNSSELELSLRSASISTSFSTSETICETETATSSSFNSSTRERRGGGGSGGSFSTNSPVNFEFCRPPSAGIGQSSYQHSNSSRAASPLLAGSSPCPSPTPRSPRSPMTPRSPRSPRSPCRSPISSQLPNSGHQTPTSVSPHRYSTRRRSGAATGNLARLASRRSSRDSEVGEPSPLQCSRNQQRRTSNFLEIPGLIRINFKWRIRVDIQQCTRRGELYRIFLILLMWGKRFSSFRHVLVRVESRDEPLFTQRRHFSHRVFTSIDIVRK